MQWSVILNLIAKITVQITLLCVFWVFFGRPSLERFSASRILVTTSTSAGEPEGILAPAVTVCARNMSKGLGWRRRRENVTTLYKDILQHQCGRDGNITACVEANTFYLTEVVGSVSKGNTSLLEPELWTEDFTWTMDGRCYTLNYPNYVKDSYYNDQIEIRLKDSSMFQIIFIHDPKLFVNNYNPKSLPMVRRKVVNGDSYTMMITLVEHQLLNRPSDPCVEDPAYSFLACVKQSFSGQAGCRLPWDSWSDQDSQVCTSLEQYKQFESLYESISDTAGSFIEEVTGCIKPCSYKEYKVAGVNPYTFEQKGFSSFFGIWYVSTEITTEKVTLVYPLTSLVADFGGTLGLFLGFSFMMLWDGAILASRVLRKIWKTK